MKIGIDARMLGNKQTGIGIYIKNLLLSLERLDNDNQYVVFLRRENWDEYQVKNKNFKKVLADYKWYSISEQIFFPFLIKKQKLDLIHFPHFNVPFFCPVKFIVSIHDLQLFYFSREKITTLPRWLYWIKLQAFKLILARAVKHCVNIITFTSYTRQDIIKYFPKYGEKTKVIYHGAGEFAQEQQSFYTKKNPYFFYIGNFYPHKNIKLLVNAFSEFVKKDYKFKLILAGKDDYFCENIRVEAQKLGLWGNKKEEENKIIFKGFVNETEKIKLYQEAVAFVFPSLLEGFGFPPLEAMYYGCPVLSSNQSCLPEILGESAVYFDGKDKNSLIKGLEEISKNVELRRKLIEKGKEQVKKYSWLKSGEETLALYERI